MKYLCSPSGTVPPNTNLELNKSFVIDGQHSFYLIENTSNITIAPSQKLFENGHDHIKVQCLPGSGGFGFFNISNLTISSVVFNDCAGVIPAPAVRYINNTGHFLRYKYNNTKTAFLFNHCYNLTLNNLIPHQRSNTSSEFSIIGVNFCGHSSISINIASIIVPNMRTLLYYIDTTFIMTPSNSKCNLHITNNSTLEMPYTIQFDTVWNSVISSNMAISQLTGWFTLLLSQQKFEANVEMSMKPTGSSPIWTGPKIGISIVYHD